MMMFQRLFSKRSTPPAPSMQKRDWQMGTFSFKRFITLMQREWRLFTSNQVAMLIFIAAPIGYALIIGLVYKDAALRDLSVTVIDLDQTPLSQKIIDAIDDNQYTRVASVLHADDKPRSLMVEKHMAAIVTIPDRFEADIQQKRHPEINVDIDGANMLTANYASTGIQTTLAVLNAGIEIETLKKKGTPATIAADQFESFKITQTRFYNPSSNYLLFLFPGMLGTIMQQVFLIVLALSFAREYEDNTFRDLVRYTRRPIYLLFVKTMPYFIIGIAIWFPLINIFFPAFNLQMPANQALFYFISVLFILAVTFMGVAVSIMMTNQLKATEVLMVIATPSFIISGQTWPLEYMPKGVQMLANTIPLTHYLQAFRSMMTYNATAKELMPQITALLILNGVFLALALLALKYKIKKAHI
jgi:ABC-2 type transport system permease protein